MSYRFLGMQYSKAINVRLLESRHYVLRQNKKQQPFDLTTWLRFCESCQNGRMGEPKQTLIHSSPLIGILLWKLTRKREKFATTRWPPLHCRRSLTPSTLPSPQPVVLLSLPSFRLRPLTIWPLNRPLTLNLWPTTLKTNPRPQGSTLTPTLNPQLSPLTPPPDPFCTINSLPSSLSAIPGLRLSHIANNFRKMCS